ncbi:MAG: hypothetical protein HOI47_27885 [Candidatus Scalindua sp.]|jgi:hypothetical protein|nr:hypothetical protein [Candidatus Scalindua sp.]MBT7350816.1 hypothetical protein [candidate division WWE3 bacterium]
MHKYKKWSAETRQASLKLTNKAKKMGWIPEPRKCRRCNQDKGIIHLHNEDYDVTLFTLQDVFKRFPVEITDKELENINEVLEPLCWRCHMVHHSIYRAPKACAEYWDDIKQGVWFEPVYKHNFNILKTEHGIY